MGKRREGGKGEKCRGKKAIEIDVKSQCVTAIHPACLNSRGSSQSNLVDSSSPRPPPPPPMHSDFFHAIIYFEQIII